MTCPTCPCQDSQTLIPDGGESPRYNGVMLLSDHMTDGDARGAKAMCGHEGAMMTRALSRYGWKLEDFKLASAAFCQPTPRWTAQACRTCGLFDHHLRQTGARVFLTVGTYAFKRLTGLDVSPLHARGYVWPTLGGGWVVAALPLSYYRANPSWLAAFVSDAAKAIRIAEQGFFAYDESITPVVNPSAPVWDTYVQAFLADPTRKISADIENPYKRRADMSEEELAGEDISMSGIDEVNFSYDGRMGVTVDFNDAYKPGIEAMLKASQEHGTTLFWNAPHDIPRLEKHTSVRFDMRHVRDTLSSFRVWRNHLPRKTMGVAASMMPSCWNVRPFKHLGTSDPFYRVMDAVALFRADSDLMLLLELEGQLPAHDLFISRLDPFLDRMTKVGVAVDSERVATLSVELGERLKAEQLAMTRLVPPSILPMHTWKGERAARAGLERLVLAGEVLPDAKLVPVPAVRKAKVCGGCGEVDVTQAHVTRKTLPPIDTSVTSVLDLSEGE
jgi:hypothetical protein